MLAGFFCYFFIFEHSINNRIIQNARKTKVAIQEIGWLFFLDLK